MKILILEITCCKKCPYYREYFSGMSNYVDKCTHPKLDAWKEIPNINEYPIWCPLPDAKKGE